MVIILSGKIKNSNYFCCLFLPSVCLVTTATRVFSKIKLDASHVCWIKVLAPNCTSKSVSEILSLVTARPGKMKLSSHEAKSNMIVKVSLLLRQKDQTDNGADIPGTMSEATPVMNEELFGVMSVTSDKEKRIGLRGGGWE